MQFPLFSWRCTAFLLMVCAHPLTVAAQNAPSAFVTADEAGNTLSYASERGDVQRIPLPVSPHNVQLSEDGKHLLATGMPASADHHSGHSQGMLLVLDVPPDVKTLRSIPVGNHPAHVITDKGGQIAYVTDSAANSLNVIDLVKERVTGQVEVGAFPHGLRRNPVRNELYTANLKDGTVSVIDTQTLTEIHRIPVGKSPVQVAVTADGSKLYVTLAKENAVAIVDLASYRKTGEIPVPSAPAQIFADPMEQYMYVANQGDKASPGNTVSVIDISTDKIIRTLSVGHMPHGIVASNNFLYVTNMGDNTVSLIALPSFERVQTFDVGKSPNGITLLEGMN